MNPTLLKTVLLSKPNLATNGQFDTDTDWTKEDTWAISGGVATKTAGVAGSLYQACPRMVSGQVYRLRLTVTRTAGTLYPVLLGSDIDLAISASGTYTTLIRAGADNGTNRTYAINIYADATFAGTVDAVSVRHVSA